MVQQRTARRKLSVALMAMFILVESGMRQQQQVRINLNLAGILEIDTYRMNTIMMIMSLCGYIYIEIFLDANINFLV